MTEPVRPRRAGATPTQEARAADASADALAALARGEVRELKRGLIHVIDARTSPICLDLARRKPVVGIDEEFETLLGPQLEPPFHDACRSLVVLCIPGEVEPDGAERAEVEAEERGRDQAEELADRRRRRREAQEAIDRERRERRERERAERARELRGAPLTLRDRQNSQGSAGGGAAGQVSGSALGPNPPGNRRVHREGDGPLPGPVRPQRTTLREWIDTAAELNRAWDPRADDDEPMRILLRRQRWTGPPVVVDRATHRVRAALAGYVLYRGLTAGPRTAAAYAEVFAFGALVLGLGAAGVGVYMALNDEQTAADYAGPDGVVLRSTPLPGARIIDVEELLALRDRELGTLTEREARSLRLLADDPGRLAGALGYDAVRFPDGTVLVVNRTALAVEEPNDE